MSEILAIGIAIPPQWEDTILPSAPRAYDRNVAAATHTEVHDAETRTRLGARPRVRRPRRDAGPHPGARAVVHRSTARSHPRLGLRGDALPRRSRRYRRSRVALGLSAEALRSETARCCRVRAPG